MGLNYFSKYFSLTNARAYILCIYEYLKNARTINIYTTGFAKVLDFL